ncbi:MAG: YhcG family protein [Fidelibacterota bacterium]
MQNLAFTHIAELITINSPLKRIFYEVECIKGNWSVRELKRQISSLYFERSGLSKDKKALANHINSLAHKSSLPMTVQDPYVFEFLGLKPVSIVLESDLETALLDRLQEFMLELGHGFCFEKRQKRILIGDEYFYVDLVFYHRILKCHVLIELKVDAFKHEYLGQLNTYLNWFRRHEMTEDDNPPIGLLLCTEKNQALIKYAKTGIDNQLYVSKYQLELPQKEDLRKFIEKQVKELESESQEKDLAIT